jgi:hypothetical protein
VICPTCEAEYFFKEGWTTQITLIWFEKFVCACRRWKPQGG